MPQRPRFQPLLLALALTLAATALASFADQWAYDHVAYATVYDTFWGVALRAIGEKYLFVWAGVAALVLVWEKVFRRASTKAAGLKASAMVLAPLVAAGFTFVLKHLAHRRRPPLEAGGQTTHLFDALFGAARHANHQAMEEMTRQAAQAGAKVDLSAFHSFPSGHTTIAFAGAFLLLWLSPRVGAVALVLAAGCALTRLFAHAHHLSDVVFAAGVGFVGAWCAAQVAAFLAPRLGIASGEKSGRRGE